MHHPDPLSSQCLLKVVTVTTSERLQLILIPLHLESIPILLAFRQLCLSGLLAQLAQMGRLPRHVTETFISDVSKSPLSTPVSGDSCFICLIVTSWYQKHQEFQTYLPCPHLPNITRVSPMTVTFFFAGLSS